MLYGGAEYEGRHACVEGDAATCGLHCCGHPGLAVAYFISYQVLCAFVLLNLVIAVILENFSSTAAEGQTIITAAAVRPVAQWDGLGEAATTFLADDALALTGDSIRTLENFLRSRLHFPDFQFTFLSLAANPSVLQK